MAAMEVVLANLIQDVSAPVTADEGGTSVGDPAAGGRDIDHANPFLPISSAETAGSYALIALRILGLILGCVFVLMDETATSRVRIGLRSCAR